jgi:parallel beta-helix repeat protein
VGCTNITVTGNSILNNTYIGIYVSASSQNVISDNTIAGNQYGLYLTTASGACTENLVANNSIRYHSEGIVLQGYPNLPVMQNVFKNNVLSNNAVGISMYLSALNQIYHNNFVNNTEQAEAEQSLNAFDHLGEGNYWSDYNGTDQDNNGIGDVPYLVGGENVDNFPLAGWFASFNIFWQGDTFVLETICSSPASNLGFNQSEKSMTFDLAADGNTTGFCTVRIPEALLGGVYEVWAGNNQISILNEQSNGTYSFLYFDYVGDVGQIEVVGQSTVPEFSPMLLTFFFAIVTALAIFLLRATMPAAKHPRINRCQCLTYVRRRHRLSRGSRDCRHMIANGLNRIEGQFSRSKSPISLNFLNGVTYF